MEKMNKLSMEDLHAIQNAKANAAYMQVLAEKAYAEKMVADLQVKNITFSAFLKYGLSSNDSIDNEGNIVRLESVEPDSFNNNTTFQKPTKKTNQKAA